MDVREAVKTAKQHLLELFNGEPISYVGLEEADFLDEDQEWVITLSFARIWETTPLPTGDSGKLPKDRHYKVFRIDDNYGRVKSVMDRD
ncbi:MAG: hypothetical protein OXE05_13310 [Chloroflexi bacterium]|nr:hypothetical protein [Chloroflexota bacterium]